MAPTTTKPTTTTMTTITTIVLLAIAAAASIPAAVVADAGFITSTCKSSDNPHCEAVLGTDPRSSNATTVKELASIGLDIAAANAANSSRYLSGEADRHYRSDEGAALDECVRQYGEAVGALDDARRAFDGGSYSEAEAQAGAAEDAGDRCEQAFTDRKLKSLVSEVDERMKERTSVASDLIDLLFVAKAKAKRSGSGRRRLLRVLIN